MDEFELIRRYFRRETTDASVLLGIGDDGAVVEPTPGSRLVLVVDTLVNGVHYPANLPGSDVGYRAVAVNVSDLAAMGAEPRWMTLSLTLPDACEAWLQDFAAGLFDAAREYGLTLVGGDTTRGTQAVISVQLAGEVPAGGYLTRHGASASDQIWVTGNPGDAAGGLELLLEPGTARNADDGAYLVRRFTRPRVRARFGVAIRRVATAAIDLSDGLGGDLDKLLVASGVSATIDPGRLPVSEPLARVFGAERARHLALDGGDDYELCFTASAADAADIGRLAAAHDVPLTCLGETTDGSGLNCLRDGRPERYSGRGFRHF